MGVRHGTATGLRRVREESSAEQGEGSEREGETSTGQGRGGRGVGGGREGDDGGPGRAAAPNHTSRGSPQPLRYSPTGAATPRLETRDAAHPPNAPPVAEREAEAAAAEGGEEPLRPLQRSPLCLAMTRSNGWSEVRRLLERVVQLSPLVLPSVLCPSARLLCSGWWRWGWVRAEL